MSAFLDGFQRASGLPRIEAEEQWAAYSRQLSDAARLRIERGGQAAGRREGMRFLADYPDPDPDTLMSLRVPRSLHAELSRAADEDERTIAATVRLAIREYLDRRKK